MKVIFASDNQGKVDELSQMLGYQITSLKDINYHDEIEEFGFTFEQNALIKAQTIGKLYPDYYVISDDSGLEVDALDGRPGIYSKRYSGKKTNLNQENNKLLLKQMENVDNRKARFTSCLCVVNVSRDICQFYKGYVEGEIGYEEIGENGFGYDPIFRYQGRSFADLSNGEKNQISHRKQALNKLQAAGVLNV